MLKWYLIVNDLIVHFLLMLEISEDIQQKISKNELNNFTISFQDPTGSKLHLNSIRGLIDA
jgi:hypothetical protein